MNNDFFKKTECLPKEIHEFLFSNDSRLELEKAFFLYALDESLIEKISGQVGLIFVGDFRLEDLPGEIMEKTSVAPNIAFSVAYEINRRIFNRFPDYFTSSAALLQKWSQFKSAPKLSEDEAWKKVLEIEPWLLEEEKEKQEEARMEREKRQKAAVNLIKIPLKQALREYPRVGEQLVSSGRINLKGFPEPVRPSVKNWLADYTFNLGHEKHSSLERSGYLFHHSNCVRLDSEEREKLGQILRSFDDDSPVGIDKTRQEIVFAREIPAPDKRVESRIDFDRRPQATVSPSPVFSRPATVSAKNDRMEMEKREAPKMSFSSPQRLPFEKEKMPPANLAPHRITPIFKKEEKPASAPAPNQMKNVVNLKDFQ